MLTFYHDLGRIVHFGSLSREKRVLSDMVILNPQWLIDVLKEIITIGDQTRMVRRDGHLSIQYERLAQKLSSHILHLQISIEKMG